jgi:parallel beta-helix repeat protein
MLALCATHAKSATCVRSSSTTWADTAFVAQTAPFTAAYDAQPGQAAMNGVVGFSLQAASGYTGLAAITRFNSNGAIDVRNGSVYAADRTVRYAAGLVYHFRVVINPVTKLYTVYVTAPGSAEVLVASNYHFRSEQAGTSTLNNWATHSDVGWESVCNMSIGSSGVAVPPAISSQPVSQRVGAGQKATFSVTASGSAPLSYQWRKNGISISGATSGTYTTPATTMADNDAQFTVAVKNSAGSITSNAATLTIGTATYSLGVNPATLSFGSEVVGGTSARQNVTVTNTGNASVAISGIVAAGDFQATNNCPASLAPAAACAVSVTFAPSVIGVRTGSVNLSDNATGSPQKVALAGTGTQATSTNSCDLYVSPAGSDASSGTLTAPWRTAQHAFASVQAGQTICLRGGSYPIVTGGTYSQTLNMSGTSTQRITITNYPGEVAILRGSTRVNGAYATFVGTPDSAPGLIFEGPTGPGANLNVIEVMNTHDVTFDHVEIRNGNYHAGLYQYNGYNIKVLGSYIHDNGVAGSNVDQGIYWDATSGGGNLIANCVIEHNAAQGIALYSSSNPSQPQQVTVEENTLINNGHYGIVVYGTGDTVVNNILANNGAVFNSQQLGIENGTNHVVDSNILWSSNASWQGTYNVTGQAVTHTVIADPLFVDAAGHNYHLRIGSPATGAGNSGYALPVDKDNVSRGAGPDLGAYEYVP